MKENQQLLEAYFKSLRDIHQSGGGVKEQSYYGTLENLLNGIGKGLKPPVRCIIQLANVGAGHPDGGLLTKEQWDQGGAQTPFLGQVPARGVIEIKPTSDDAWVTAESDQVSEYWKMYQLVLVTNYRDFVLIGKDEHGKPSKRETYRLAESENDFWLKTAHPQKFAVEHGGGFTEYLRRAMLHAAPISSPRELAWFLASYARTAASRIEGKDVPAMKSVRDALEAALGLKFEGEKGEHFFRSTLVQTVFYGLFSAWVLWSKKRSPAATDRFDWHNAVWQLQVPVMQGLFGQIVTPAHVGPLEIEDTLDWASATLNRVDRAAFFSAFEQDKAVQYFYEPFLEAFDPELRKELGVWYTPHEIVQYMVARVDTALREELHVEDGLADPKVYILDPCCGTGSYLVEVLRRIHQTLKSKSGDALVANDLKQAALKRVLGFEILAAPFVVAHMQVGLLLQTLGAPLSESPNERAAVYLTNALTGWEPLDPEKEKAFQAMLTGFPQLLDEQMDARRVKREVPILVILGNPPYNAFAGTATTEEERASVAPYKEGLVKKWGIKKFNLDDLYVRFFRMAERRIAEQTGQGVVCLISNFSYLADPSFVVLRQRFLSGFDRLWIDNMNGDSRETGKRTPEGKPDPSVFSTEYNKAGIRVGTAIALLARKLKRKENPLVKYRQFWGNNKRADLLNSLGEADATGDYQLVGPAQDNRYSFRPGAVEPQYYDWPRVVELVGTHPYNGPVERRALALISIDKPPLESRMRAYFDASVSNDQIAIIYDSLMMTGNRIVGPEARQKILKEFKYDESKIVRYPFKPFDIRWCYLENLRPLFSEPSPQLLQHRFAGNAFFLTRDTADKKIEGAPFYYSAFVCDYDSVSGHARHFPIFVRSAVIKNNNVSLQQTHFLEKMGEGSSLPVANLSSSARNYLTSTGITDPDADAHTAGLIWMHALAIGYSPAYLDENADGIRKDWPRIPLPATKQLLEASAALGEKVAALLDTEKAVAGVTASPLRLEMQGIAVITREGGGNLKLPEDLAITVGWGHGGQGGVVMPGKGKAIERDYSPEEQLAIASGAGQLGIPPDEALELLGERTLDVYLNGVAYWRNVPTRVWEYTIGGYQVIKKWLSYRENKLLGRPLTPDEAREVTNMARRIAAILLLRPALDANYLQSKQNVYPWPPAKAPFASE